MLKQLLLFINKFYHENCLIREISVLICIIFVRLFVNQSKQKWPIMDLDDIYITKLVYKLAGLSGDIRGMLKQTHLHTPTGSS